MILLSQVLSSKVRAAILSLLFGGIENELHLREIARRSGMAVRTVQQDLAKLLALDLIRARRDGNRLYFRANADHPAFADLHGLVAKTSGLIPSLQEVLSKAGDIQCAFVFGSFARRQERADSDVDLFVIGDIGARKLSSILGGIEKIVVREINPHTFTPEEFRKRRRTQDHFVQRILESEKLFVVGTQRDLEAMG